MNHWDTSLCSTRLQPSLGRPCSRGLPLLPKASPLFSWTPPPLTINSQVTDGGRRPVMARSEQAASVSSRGGVVPYFRSFSSLGYKEISHTSQTLGVSRGPWNSRKWLGHRKTPGPASGRAPTTPLGPTSLFLRPKWPRLCLCSHLWRCRL